MEKIKLKNKEMKLLQLAFHIGITYVKSDKKAVKLLKLKNKIFEKK